jgi:hypothetical protein
MKHRIGEKLKRRINMKKIIVNGENKFYGTVGETTNYMVNNQYLQVGDVVKVYSNSGYINNENFVCKNDEYEYFVMGIAGSSDSKNGEFLNGWRVELLKKYYEVKDYESYDGLKIIDGDNKLLKFTNEELLTELRNRKDIDVIHSISNKNKNIYIILEK